MLHPTQRLQRIAFCILLALLTGLTGASHVIAQPPPSWADLLTPTTVVEASQDLTSSSSIEGIPVDVHSKALTRGTPQLHIQTLDGTIYRADLEHLSWTDQGIIHWAGSISTLGVSCPVLLSTHGGRVVGVIETPEGRFEVIPTSSGHVLKQVASSRLGRCDLARAQFAAALR